MKSIAKICSILHKNIQTHGRIYTTLKSYTTQSASSDGKKIEILFLNPEVQNILKKITGLNYEKVFAPSKKPLTPHKFQFATEKQLKQLQDIAAAKAYKKLQMPPVMGMREPIDEVLSKDPDLQGYLKHTTVFIDISSNVFSRDRMITVREVDGTLRKATWEERERMNQIFFPIAGRNLETPVLFESPNLERLLDESEYEFVLDLACVQFEPDSPDYHRVTSKTYEHLQQSKKFDMLRSTRHFGPMAFYFAYKKNIDSLLLDMIKRNLINDASDTVRLLYILHPELQTSSNIDDTNEVELTQDYIKNHSTLKGDLELALQTLLEQQQSSLQKEEASA